MRTSRPCTRSRGALIALGAMALPLTLFAGAGLAQQADDASERQKLRQLEVFEELLTETVQEYVNLQVNASVQAHRQRDVDGDGTADVTLEPLVVKVGAASAAHGLYIAGYGVIFSIQTPQLAVIPRGFETRLAQPLSVFRLPARPPDGGNLRHVADGVIEFRTRSMQLQLRELESLLEQSTESGDSARNALLIQQIKELTRGLTELERATTPPGEADVAESEAQRARLTLESARDTDRRYFTRIVEQQQSIKEILERNHEEMNRAVNDAAIQTLASYGGVIKGLDSDDRVSVLVFPPSPWSLARSHGVGVGQQEYVISIRYKDIRDLDNQKIDLAQFRERVHIHSRLGTEIGTAPHQR